jgi:hypothetical protein
MKLSTLALLAAAGALVAGRALPDTFPFLSGLSPRIDPLYNSSLAALGIEAQTGATPPPAGSDALWEKCRCRGEMLTHGMTLSDKDAGKLFNPQQDTVQSRFTSFPHEFKRWFYTFKDTERSGPDVGDFEAWGIMPALQSLGVSDQSTSRRGRNKVLSVEHWDPKAKDEGNYPIPIEDQTYTVRLDNGRVVELPVCADTSSMAIVLMLTG